MRLSKSSTDKVLFGVCGGLSKYTGIDSVLLRIIFIFGTIFTGSLLLWIYLLFALVLPKEE